jgi:hypothetical protein
MNKSGKSLWMLNTPKQCRGKVHELFWKRVVEVSRECGLKALQALLGVLPTGSSNPTIDDIVATLKDPVFVSIDTEGVDTRQRSGEPLGLTELGISILDTRQLQETLPTNLSDALSTFSYETEKYCKGEKPRS